MGARISNLFNFKHVHIAIQKQINCISSPINPFPCFPSTWSLSVPSSTYIMTWPPHYSVTFSSVLPICNRNHFSLKRRLHCHSSVPLGSRTNNLIPYHLAVSLATSTRRCRNKPVLQQSRSLVAPVCHGTTCVLTTKYSCFLLLHMTSDPVSALWSFKLGDILDSNGLPQGPWALTQSTEELHWPSSRQAESWRGWSGYFCCCLPQPRAATEQDWSHWSNRCFVCYSDAKSVISVLVLYSFTHSCSPDRDLLNLPQASWALLTA